MKSFRMYTIAGGNIFTWNDFILTALWATASEGLAQGPYVVARVGFEPATFWMEGAEPHH